MAFGQKNTGTVLTETSTSAMQVRDILAANGVRSRVQKISRAGSGCRWTVVFSFADADRDALNALLARYGLSRKTGFSR